MAKSKKEVTLAPAAKKASTLKPNTGALYKLNDEGEFSGTVHLAESGEYWTEARLKKDESGKIHLAITATKKKDDAPVDESNLDRGVFYKNNRKRLKNQPDYTGTIGVSNPGEYELRGAIMESRQGVTYMSLEIVSDSDEEFDAESFAF